MSPAVTSRGGGQCSLVPFRSPGYRTGGRQSPVSSGTASRRFSNPSGTRIFSATRVTSRLGTRARAELGYLLHSAPVWPALRPGSARPGLIIGHSLDRLTLHRGSSGSDQAPLPGPGAGPHPLGPQSLLGQVGPLLSPAGQDLSCLSPPRRGSTGSVQQSPRAGRCRSRPQRLGPRMADKRTDRETRPLDCTRAAGHQRSRLAGPSLHERLFVGGRGRPPCKGRVGTYIQYTHIDS